MSPSPLRVAFAGANASRGWAKDAHLAAVRSLPGLALTAVAARDQSLANEAAMAFGVDRGFGDAREMARDPDVDIVAVTVKVPEHRAIVLAALDAGKHVYCEWPLGRDRAEAREMAEAARTAGVHVAIGLQGVLAPAVREAAALVASGAIGAPQSLRMVSPTAGWGAEAPPFYAYLQDKTNGATLSTIAGGHSIAVVEATVGPLAEISAINSILNPHMRITGSNEMVERTCPDHVLVIGRHENGCISSLEVIGGEARSAFVFELRGDKGMLALSGHFPGGFQASSLSLTVNGEPMALPMAATSLTGPPANVAELYAALERDIRCGTHTVPDFDRAVRLTEVLDGIDAASDEGRRVRFEQQMRMTA